MKKSLIFVASAIAIVLLSLPGTAKAQVGFGVRGPHGSFSIGVGGPFVPVVGAYVPQPFVEQVYLSPDYGYGFEYDSRWIPCRRYGSQWIIAGSPVVYGRQFVRNYGYRSYGYRSVQPYRHSGRAFARRDRDDRSLRRDRDGRSFRRDRNDRRW